MNDHLRTISVHVAEPESGCYYWVLMESTEDAAVFSECMSSAEPTDIWAAALDAGIKVLKAMATDPARGPRSLGEDENADPVG